MSRRTTLEIEVNLSPETAAGLDMVLARINRDAAMSSHGPLDPTSLIDMLLTDIAMIAHRPGSWEASNMLTVLQSHGYLN